MFVIHTSSKRIDMGMEKHKRYCKNLEFIFMTRGKVKYVIMVTYLIHITYLIQVNFYLKNYR